MEEPFTPFKAAARDLLASVAAALGWSAAGLWLVDAEASVLRCVEIWLDDPTRANAFERASLDIALACGVGLPGRVWQDRRAHWVADVVQDPNFPRAAMAASCGLHAAMAVPIRTEGGAIRGVVEFLRGEPGPAGDDLARASLEVGRHVAHVIEWRAAEAAVRWSEARKTAILESALDAVVTIDDVGRVTEWNPAAERIFGCQRAEALGRELAELIVPLALRDRHRKALARYMAGDRNSGALIGARTELPAQRADGSEFPIELTLTRVKLPGPPMVTAYLRDVSEHVRLDREREAFRVRSEQLQRALLPRVSVTGQGIVVTSCYRPGEQRLALGGDFYDAVELPDGTVAMVIGDVSGHGPDAAAIGANLRASWRMLALARRRPEDLVRELELMVVAERGTAELFVTLCCAWIAPGRDRLSVLSAGHPPPLLLGPTPVSIVCPTGPPLGVVEDGRWEVFEHRLGADAELLFYTDGLVEGRASPGSDRRFGLDGLIALLPGTPVDQGILDGVLDAAVAAHGEELPDDVAVLVIRLGVERSE